MWWTFGLHLVTIWLTFVWHSIAAFCEHLAHFGIHLVCICFGFGRLLWWMVRQAFGKHLVNICKNIWLALGWHFQCFRWHLENMWLIFNDSGWPGGHLVNIRWTFGGTLAGHLVWIKRWLSCLNETTINGFVFVDGCNTIRNNIKHYLHESIFI